MPSNSQIRTLHFAQGVDIQTSPTIMDDQGEIDFSNNVAATSTGLTFDLLTFREIIFDYSIRRRTDSTTGIIERGRFKLTANPDGATDADKWILSLTNKDDEGVISGATFSITVSAGVVTLQYATTNLAGANHHCYFVYALTSFII